MADRLDSRQHRRRSMIVVFWMLDFSKESEKEVMKTYLLTYFYLLVNYHKNELN